MKGTDFQEYILFRLVQSSGSLLPAGAQYRIWRRLGRILGRKGGYRRGLVRTQLAMVYPDKSGAEVEAMTRAVYEHLGATLAEVLWTPRGGPMTRVRALPDWSALDKAYEAGRGVLVVSAHLGNFEWGGRVLAARYPVLDVVKPMRNPLIESYLERERRNHGIATVPMDASGRAVLAHLRRGGVVTLLIDQDAGTKGVAADFLGHPASTWPGAARLAIRTGSPVVPVAMVRESAGRHALRIGEVVSARGMVDSGLDIRELTRRLTAAVESFVREHPEQWFWVHRRWKSAGEIADY